MNDIEYKIAFRKGDFAVEVQGDKVWVEAKFKELISEDFKASLPKEFEKGGLPETLGEFLDKKNNPKKHTDIIAVFAYWLFKKVKFQSFNVKDIVNCYDETRIPKPKNPNQIINVNVSSHIFATTSEKKDGLKTWVITKTGEDYVEQMK